MGQDGHDECQGESPMLNLGGDREGHGGLWRPLGGAHDVEAKALGVRRHVH